MYKDLKKGMEHIKHSKTDSTEIALVVHLHIFASPQVCQKLNVVLHTRPADGI